MALRRLLTAVETRVALWRLDEWSQIGYFRERLGVVAGDRVRITGQVNWGSEPYLITIGDDVTITDGVRFITHDGGAALFRDFQPGLNVYGRITIGDHVFIGSGVTILPGITIGDSVVIGAGAVVTKDVPGGVVIAGNPARVIRPIAEYRDRIFERGVIISSRCPAERRSEIERAVDGGSE